jgi:hypothetical protein
MMESMELDPIPEDVRQFLIKNFKDVRDEPAQGDYYVFNLKTNSGEPRTLKVHRNFFIYSEMVTAYLQEHDFVGKLEYGNHEIAEPIR